MRFIKIRYLEKYYLEIFYFLLSLIYFITIQYTWVFRKIHETKGFEVDFFFIKYVIVTCFVLYTIKFFKKPKSDYFSKNILGVVLILDFIPSSIFYSSTVDIDWRIYFFHILLFYSLALTLSFKFNLRIKTLNKKQVLIFLLLMVLVGILPYFRYISYINFKNLILIDIYDTRLKFRGLFDAYSGYTHSWLTRVVIPIIFVLSLKYKLKAIAVLNTLLLLFLYLMGAVKSVLLGSLLVVVFYFINKDKILPFITKGLIVLLLIAIFSYPFVEHDLNFFSVVVFRRMMFIPSLLDYCYFDFFDNNHLYWSNSFLKGITTYNYSESAPRLIGLEYFGKEAMAANNGLISDGFSNVGTIGVLITLFLFNTFMLVVKNCKVDSKYFGIYFFILYGFLTTAISTVLITHGGLILLLLTLLILRRKVYNE